jgi:RHS repeat-associated protein
MNLPKFKIVSIIFFTAIIQFLSLQKIFSQSCVTGLGTESLEISELGDFVMVEVSCYPSWCDTWSAYTSANWIFVDEDYYEQAVYIDIAANESEEERNANILIDGHYIHVYQEGVCNIPEPEFIAGSSIVCSNCVVLYSISEIEDAIYYSWSLTNGGTILAGQGSANIEASFSNTGSATLSVYATKSCGNGPSEELNINIWPGSSQSLEYKDTIRLDSCPILTGNHDIRAHDMIILGDGFSYTASSGSMFTARIDRSIRDDGTYLSGGQIPDPETRELDTDLIVGSTEGSMLVTPIGGASYSVPLNLPPGVNGLAPNLSIAYSSSGGPSIAGYGWNIGGLSIISRGPRTIFHDGVASGVNLDINDRFYLDGQRLVNTSSTYGSPTAQYQTDNDILTRVTPEETTSFGPAWFKAETKSGLIYEYGNSSGSKQKIDGYSKVLNWYVSRISDLFGNVVYFNYIQDSHSVYPSEITYGPNVITFFYKNRDDTITSYIKGTEIEQRLLLDKITISYNSTLIKTYEFKHSFQGSNYNSYSILNEVVESGKGTGKMNSTAFSYQLPANVGFAQTKYDTEHEYITYKSKLVTGDFNGDGKTDFLCLPDADNGATWTGMRVYTSNGDDNFTYSFSDTTQLDLDQLRDIRSLDLNADGIDDIIYEYVPPGAQESFFKYKLCNGSSFLDKVQISTQTDNTHTGLTGKSRRNDQRQEDDNERVASSKRHAPWIYNRVNADYNGDGVNDIFINKSNGDWSFSSFINSSGEMTSGLNPIASGNEATLDYNVLSGDFNGDGKSDIWSIDEDELDIYTLTGTNLVVIKSELTPTVNHYFTTGDFNGDGKVDLFVYGYYDPVEQESYDWPEWQIRLSTGTDFKIIYVPRKKLNLKDDYIRVGDFNGDGASDLMVTSKDQSWTDTYFYISKDGGTDFYSHLLNNYPAASHKYSLGDFNGDGRFDFICTDGEYQWWNGYQVYKTVGNTAILMDKVGNGFGQLTKLSYTKMSEAPPSIYQRDDEADYPVTDFQGPMTIVDSVFVDNGKGSMNIHTYYYEGAKIHIQGKGLLGYKKTISSDNSIGIKSESLSGYDETYFYPQVNETLTKLASNNDTISWSVNTWNKVELDAQKKRIFPYLQSSTQYNWLTGHSVTTSNQYDSYGNPTSVSTSYSGGLTDSTTVIFDNSVSSTEWLLGRPTKTTKYFIDNDTTISRKVSNVFSTNNNTVTRDTAFAGTNYQIVHAYGHNSNGTLQSESAVTGAGTRSTSYTYEPDGMRIHTTTDPLSHVTTSTYDTYGRLYTKKDYLGNTVTYQYDDLGRPLTVASTDGYQTTTAFSWESPASEPKPARYSVQETGHDGSQKKSWYDKLSRVIRSDVKGFDGTMIYSVTKYNTKGQVDSISDPYYSTGSALWNKYYYDENGRKERIERPSGRDTEWTYEDNSVTETIADREFTKVLSSSGTLTSATDPGGTITYTYFPDGKPKTITAPGNNVTSMKYDIAGNQCSLVDPSAGTIYYTYNGFGELTEQKNARNQTTSISYNSDGTIHERVTPEGTTTYTYNSNKQLTGISSPGNINRSYQYDSKGRQTDVKESIAGTSSFSTSLTYDDKGRISTITHPSGTMETNTYNANGYLSCISAGGSARWTIQGMNARGQITSGKYGSNLETTFGYDSYGYPTSTETGSIQDYIYNFNTETGNLNWRENDEADLREDFHYDDLDRLDGVNMGENMTLDMSYDENTGGISLKDDAGTFNYDTPSKPYAISSIDPRTDLVPECPQWLGYTSFESVKGIGMNGDTAIFDYNSDNERIKMVVLHEEKHVLTRWYSGSFMKDSTSSGVKTFTYIGGDAYSTPVVAITEGGSPGYYYLLKDYLGNVTHVVNSSNALVAEYSYDAWGRMRNPASWANYAPGSEPELFTGRGYTGHEHLPWFNLINMNGRVYDPLIGMFLSPDNFLQSADFTQSFNRYAYCLNNPLIYTDPDGEWIFTLLCSIIPGAQFLLPVAIGADIGWMTGGMKSMEQGKSFWYGAWRGGVTGSVGGGLSMIGGAGMSFAANLGLGTAEGALTGGLDAALWHNDIGKGMLWGAAGGALMTTVTSENMSNLFKGEGFYTNENVFNNMMGRGMGKQEMLDYFGFKGSYRPDIKGPSYHQEGSYWGTTLGNGDIAFGDLAFENYGTLKGTYIKESFHVQKVLNGIPYDKVPEEFQGLKFDIYPEEISGYIHAYKNQGLFSGHNFPFKGIEHYQRQLRLFDIPFRTYPKSWIYKIPRRW